MERQAAGLGTVSPAVHTELCVGVCVEEEYVWRRTHDGFCWASSVSETEEEELPACIFVMDKWSDGTNDYSEGTPRRQESTTPVVVKVAPATTNNKPSRAYKRQNS